MVHRLLPLMLVGALAATLACGRKPDPKAEAAKAGTAKAPASRSDGPLRSRLDATPAYVSADDGEGARHWKTVRAFYESNGWKPVWVSGRKPTPQAQALIAAVQKAEAEGLNAAQYDLPDEGTVAAAASWNPLKKGLADDQALDLDLRLSYAFVKYATHMASGRTDPATVDSHWFVTPRKIDAAAVMKQALDSGNVEQALRSLAPQHPQYERLRETLARYRDIAARGGWPTLPDGLRLKPGSRGPQVAVLRERLAASGDLAQGDRAQGDVAQQEAPAPVASPAPKARPTARATATPSAVFDAEVRAALKRFEQRHGLNADGLLDAETVRALNVPVEERIEQLTLNMERWRWLPESLGERHILVNVPTYQLDVYENGHVVLPMRVVAGKKENPTPIFMDKMENVVFSPYWNVPPDIARKETIPAAMRDPGYLSRNDMELVKGSHVVSPWSVGWDAVAAGNYTFRQRPGEKNALGHVKFLFPNQFDVYLHDTPADSLFARTDRSFSHGCVRVEKPEELAEYVLRSQPEWTPERIRAAMYAGVEKWVTLKEPLPVYILYMTAWVEPDGAVQFREDIYGHDQKQQKLLPLLSPAPPRMAQVQPPTA
jgi:murein L,D-transpeptidase YcbB/YkuD